MYLPQPDDEGLQLLSVAIRDYIASDTAPKGVVELLPGEAQGIIPEGFMTGEIETPVVLLAKLGFGEAAAGGDVRLVRFIVYVLDRGRGYFAIEKVLHRVLKLFNDTPRALEYLTFPAEEPLKVLSIKAPGGTATASFPQWQCEGEGLYLFVEVRGLPTAD
jgi:hypothetical protein